MEEARTSVADSTADLRGSVAVGVIPTVAPYFIPAYTASFAKKYPEARLRIVEETTPVLVDFLRNLSIDLAVLALPLRHKDLEVFPLRSEPLFAVLPQDHPKAGAKSLSINELRGESFVMLRDGHCFRESSLAACSRARITPRIAFESDQFSSVLGMVSAGVGVSLIPEMALATDAKCSYVRLSDARATRTIVAAVLRGRSLNRIQKAFLKRLQTQKVTAEI
ncbi:MAG: LysR family transcriptional regulator substrate-binding protein [Acidobacteriaceae bacterium]|nr:LysR family transcriptional regulator substrate-binding protein [Acidobacteriaceae bacterium]